jgi:hypothetical protein
MKLAAVNNHARRTFSSCLALQSRQMPRRYLCVLPSSNRPSLFSGD